MQVRLLGTAAGGGFPQWNCNCRNCAAARSDPFRAKPRTQSCAAISADGRRWFLLNASPDIRVQIESFVPLLPQHEGRGSAIEAVLLSSADLDHVLGLFVLREGSPLTVHASEAVRESCRELGVDRVLGSYCGIDWRTPPGELADLLCRDGTPSGLKYSAFAVPGHAPRYNRQQRHGEHVLGYRIVDPVVAGCLVYLPDLGEWNETVDRNVRDCDALLLDGTFWKDDEMHTAGVGEATAASMGHLPISGPGGTLERMRGLPARHKIYVHINNTNPILLEDSAERREVEAAGVIVGWDGMELTL